MSVICDIPKPVQDQLKKIVAARIKGYSEEEMEAFSIENEMKRAYEAVIKKGGGKTNMPSAKALAQAASYARLAGEYAYETAFLHKPLRDILIGEGKINEFDEVGKKVTGDQGYQYVYDIFKPEIKKPKKKKTKDGTQQEFEFEFTLEPNINGFTAITLDPLIINNPFSPRIPGFNHDAIEDLDKDTRLKRIYNQVKKFVLQNILNKDLKPKYYFRVELASEADPVIREQRKDYNEAKDPNRKALFITITDDRGVPVNFKPGTGERVIEGEGKPMVFYYPNPLGRLESAYKEVYKTNAPGNLIDQLINSEGQPTDLAKELFAKDEFLKNTIDAYKKNNEDKSEDSVLTILINQIQDIESVRNEVLIKRAPVGVPIIGGSEGIVERNFNRKNSLKNLKDITFTLSNGVAVGNKNNVSVRAVKPSLSNASPIIQQNIQALATNADLTIDGKPLSINERNNLLRNFMYLGNEPLIVADPNDKNNFILRIRGINYTTKKEKEQALDNLFNQVIKKRVPKERVKDIHKSLIFEDQSKFDDEINFYIREGGELFKLDKFRLNIPTNPVVYEVNGNKLENPKSYTVDSFVKENMFTEYELTPDGTDFARLNSYLMFNARNRVKYGYQPVQKGTKDFVEPTTVEDVMNEDPQMLAFWLSEKGLLDTLGLKSYGIITDKQQERGVEAIKKKLNKWRKLAEEGGFNVRKTASMDINFTADEQRVYDAVAAMQKAYKADPRMAAPYVLKQERLTDEELEDVAKGDPYLFALLNWERVNPMKEDPNIKYNSSVISRKEGAPTPETLGENLETSYNSVQQVDVERQGATSQDFRNIVLDILQKGDSIGKLKSEYTTKPIESGMEQSIPSLEQLISDGLKDYGKTFIDPNTATQDFGSGVSDDFPFKIVTQKERNEPATAAQKAQAKAWYENSPLSKVIPFEAMFDAVNSKNPQAIAMWSTQGITLYKGSDYTDLYHEAWHGFTQMFLTKEDKNRLYKELGSRTGSFLDQEGNEVTFKNASVKQLEEFLAEDFRSYMLNGQKAVKNSVVRNSIFRKIWNALKTLFKFSSVRGVVSDAQIDKNIGELYRKLKKGELNEWSPSHDNTTFSSLAKTGIQPENKEDEPFTLSESLLISESIDSMLYMGFRKYNDSDAKDPRLAQKTFLNNPAAANYFYGSTDISDDKHYGYSVKKQIQNRIDELKADDKSQGKGRRAKRLQSNIAFLEKVLRNFNSVVAYHSKVSDAFYREEFTLDGENQTALEQFDAAREGFGEGGNSKSIGESLSTELKMVLSSIPRTTIKDEYVGNELGFPQIVPLQEMWNKLIRDLENTVDFESMIDTLKELSKSKPEYKAFLDIMPQIKAGEKLSQEKNQIWTQFFQVFNMTRAEMSVFYVNREEGGKYNSRIGFSGGAFNKTKRKMANDFNNIIKPTRARVKVIKDGRVQFGVKINAAELFVKGPKGYDQSKLKVDPYDFLKAIGLELTDTPELREELRKNPQELKRLGERVLMYDFLQKMYPGRGEFYITNFDEFFQALPENIVATLEDFYSNPFNNYGEWLRSLKIETEDSEGYKYNIDLNELYNIGGPQYPNFLHDFNKLANLGSQQERTNFSYVIAAEADYTFDENNFQRSNAEGNTQFEHTLNNEITIITKAVNDIRYNNYYDLISNNIALQHLDFKRNPLLRGDWLSKLFDLEFNPKTGEYEGTGDRIIKDGKPVTLKVKNFGGINVDYDGVSYASSDATSKLIADMHQMLIRNISENARHADKNTSYSSQLSVNDPYIPIIEFTSSAFQETFMQKYFIKYLANEMERMKRMRNIDKSQPYDKFFAEKGKEFVLLKSIYDKLDADSKQMLDDAIEGKDDFNPIADYEKATSAGFRESLKKALFDKKTGYFNSQIDPVLNMLTVKDNSGQNSAFFSTAIAKMLKDKSGNSLVLAKENLVEDDVPTEMGRRVLAMSFIMNSWIDHIEKVNFFYGDLAQYNHAKQDFHKRNAGAGSTGQGYRTDSYMIEYLQGKKEFTKKYFEDEGIDTPIEDYSETMETAIVENMNIDSAYFDDLVERYTDEEVERLESAGKKADRKKIKAQVERIFSPYKGMDEADAQGYITIDAYRELKEAQGAWDSAHQEMYDKLLNGEPLLPSEIKEFFSPIKAQYWGPLKTDASIMAGLPVTAMHKYSLLPLIPNMIEGTKLQQLHEKMMRENIGYVTFQSGSKLGTIGKDGAPDKIYFDQQARESDIPNSEPFTKNTIILRYLKDQMDIADKMKGQVIFSTQLRKLVEQNLMRGGVPVDYLKKDSKNTPETWNKLTDEQKRKESRIFRVVQAYEENIDTLTDLAKKDILKKVGYVEVKDKDGNVTGYRPKEAGNLSKLLSFAKSELSRQDFGENEMVIINSILNAKNSGNVQDLSYSLSSAQIAKVINSLITKKLINQKVNGESLVQASESLFEKIADEGRNFKSPTKEERALYGTKDLPFYEYNADRTKAMKVKIAMQGDFLKLLQIDGIRVDKADGTIDELASLANLNAKLKDENWLNEGDNRSLVTMNAVRIPVQGLNSMEFMEVYEFLPPGAPNIIITSSEIVAKSGADFDIDKMSVIMPNIMVLNNKAVSYSKENISEARETLKAAKKKRAKIKKDRIADFKKIKENYIEDKDKEKFNALVKPFNDKIAQYEEDLQKIKDKNKVLLSRDGSEDLIDEEVQELEIIGSKIDFYDKELAEIKSKKYESIKAEFGNVWEEALQKHQNKFNSLENANEAIIKDLNRSLRKAEVKAAQNNILTSMVDMLSLPENFGLLTKPNTTDDLLSIRNDLLLIKSGVTREELKELNNNPEEKKKALDKLKSSFSPTQVFEPLFNIEKHQSNKVGKQILGIIAIDNTFDTLFNRIGMRLSNNGQRSVRFRHNVVKAPDSNRRQSDLSQIYDVDQKFRISDIISQLINGSVDVAKDDWISQIQGNKEAISTLLLLNQAGVPIEEAIYFLSIDAIQDYNNEIRLTKSKFAEPLNTAARYGEGSKIISKIRALRNLRERMAAAGIAEYREEIALIDNFFAERDKLEQDAVQMGQRPETFNKTLERLIENVLFIGDKRINTVFTNNPSLHKKVSTVDLFDTLSGAGNKPLANEFKALLHYFELEKPTDAITTLKNNLNFDTTKSSSTYEAYNKRESIINLRAKGEDSLGYDPEFINKILTDSPIRSFYIQDLQIALMNGLFPTQTSNALLDELRSRIESGEGRDSTEIQRIVSRLFGDKEAYAKKFVEDFPTYLIQRMLKDFDMTSFKAGSYKGFEVSEVVKTDIQEAAVLLKDGKLYFSEAVLEDEYNKYKNGTLEEVANNIPPPSQVLKTKDQYLYFLLERAALQNAKSFETFKDEKGSIEYKHYVQMAQGDVETAYKYMINSQALFNINNNDSIFRTVSEDSALSMNYTNRFLAITSSYPQLAKMFNVINDLRPETTSNPNDGSLSVSILTLGGTKLTANNINHYNSELEKLSDRDQLRELTDKSGKALIKEEDIDFIANLFEKFPEIAFMQSGMASNSTYALTRIVNQEKILRLMGNLAEKVNDPRNGMMLDALVRDFGNQFEEVNLDKYLRVRNKDYNSDTSIIENIYEALNNPESVGLEASDIAGTAEGVILNNSTYRTLQSEMKPRFYPMLLSANSPSNVGIYDSERSNLSVGEVMDAALNGESKVGKKATLDDSLKWGELKDLSDAYESPKGVNTMRMQKGNPVEQFGNPFMGTYRGGKKPAKSQPGQMGLFDEALPYDNQTSFPTIKEATDAYIEWLKGERVFPGNESLSRKDAAKRRDWILDQINQGKLDGQTLLYYKPKSITELNGNVVTGGYYSHADALRDFVNSRPSTNKDQNESYKVVSEAYGVVQAETNPSEEKQRRFVEIIKPQIKAQATKENTGANANHMFQYGVRWTRVELDANPLDIKSWDLKNRTNRITEIARLKAEGKTKLEPNKFTYAYHEKDQNGNPLPELSTLQPIIDDIQNALGIDMSDYDAVIGNIYLPGQQIQTHRDTTESKSARNYPVIVYTLGAGNGINIFENIDNPGKVSFAAPGNKETAIPTKAGTIYTFGMDGNGRFEMAHNTPRAPQKGETLEPITMPDGRVIKDYTITLTFRRAKDLEASTPKKPKRFEPIPATETTQAGVNPAEYTNHSGGAAGADSMFDTIGKEFGQENHKHYYYGSKTPKGNVALTENQVKEGVVEMNKAAKILGRKPSKQSTINLLARNWFQVKNSTQVIAIAPIDSSMKFVEGGTGWAVAMAQANNKEINVFNLKDNSWYKWDGETFVKSSTPVLAKNFAGIGSRQDKGKMTPESIQAIRDVYEKTFNEAPTAQAGVKTYTGLIKELSPNQVFVFGSNLKGLHGKGAAGVAFGKQQSVAEISKVKDGTKGKWAVKGVGEGLQEGTEGKSYAFPSVVYPGKKKSRTDAEIKESVKKFYDTAKNNPNLEFLVAYSTKPGLAGYTPQELANFFSSQPIPSNVIFEEGFSKLLTTQQQAEVVSAQQTLSSIPNGLFVYDKAEENKGYTGGSRDLVNSDSPRAIGLPTLKNYLDSSDNIIKDDYIEEKAPEKIVTDEVVEEFNKLDYVPKEWFFHNRVFTKSVEGSGKGGVMNQNTKFKLDEETELYDLVNVETGEVLRSNIDLSTGMQTFPGTGGLVANQKVIEQVDKITDKIKESMDKEGFSVFFPKTGIAQELIASYPRDSYGQAEFTEVGNKLPSMNPTEMNRKIKDMGRERYFKTLGVQTFIEISKMLYDKFGYINLNFAATSQGKQFLLSRSGTKTEPMTASEVNGFRAQC